MLKPTSKQTAWVVAVDMGYGHLRAAWPLAEVFNSPLINANKYSGIPTSDSRRWASLLSVYTRLSRLSHWPVMGPILFDWFDSFQRIKSLTHTRLDRRPSWQLKFVYHNLYQGWMRGLVIKLNPTGLPLVTTFPVPALAAEVWNYQGEIYCVTTDFEINRAWAPLDAKKTRIHYLVPSRSGQERLQAYGVPARQITITGFPLPLDNLGGLDLKTTHHDLAHRLVHLDPYKQFITEHKDYLEKTLGRALPERSNKRVSLMLAIGGTGVQQTEVLAILEDLQQLVRHGLLRITLVAGSRQEVVDNFERGVRSLRLGGRLGKNLMILFEADKIRYLKIFASYLHQADILWTKPSELSFYAGLGVPIIMASPVGSQEKFNRLALLRFGAGLDQPSPEGFSEWLRDKIDSGDLARMAWHGYREIEKLGTYNIFKAVNPLTSHKLF